MNVPKSRNWLVQAVIQIFDSHATPPPPDYDPDAPIKHRFDLFCALPLIVMHLLCFAVLWTGWSWAAVGMAVFLYFFRMFAITGFYHRYFSHKSYRANRFWQFWFAVAGNSAAQRGPLWWAAHHRHHHKHADEDPDLHSPTLHGLFWAHIGWVCSPYSTPTHLANVKDFAKFPELRFLDRFDKIVPFTLGGLLFALGAALEHWLPHWGTNGMQMFIWGFVVSTVAVFHGTFTINSLTHTFGSRRYPTADTSRNSLILAMVTLGEGWHNNHHFFPASCRQGFFWWEIDITYYILRTMNLLGIVHDIRKPPPTVYDPAATISAGNP